MAHNNKRIPIQNKKDREKTFSYLSLCRKTTSNQIEYPSSDDDYHEGDRFIAFRPEEEARDLDTKIELYSMDHQGNEQARK